MGKEQAEIKLLNRLGEGRVGEVWLAQQKTRGGLARLVAVKLLREEWAEDKDAVTRLRDEGQMLAMLQHPATVGFHDLTEVEGRLALITEYIEGVDLEEYTKSGRGVPARVAVDIVASVAAALAWAQRTPNPTTGRPLNLIHRDIKPSNIRLSDDGHVKLLDFGLARSNEMKRHAKTRMGEVLGTPGYAAPEALAFQVMSAPGDVYALGCTLYELLVGEPLFHGKSTGQQAALALQSRDYADFINERLQKVENTDLRMLLDDMLAYQPEKRPSAEVVCDTCEDQVAQMDGPTFSEWNRARLTGVTRAQRMAAAPLDEKPTNYVPIVVGCSVVAVLGMGMLVVVLAAALFLSLN